MLNLAAALPTALGAASGAEKLPLIPHIPELIFGFVMLGVVYDVAATRVLEVPAPVDYVTWTEQVAGFSQRDDLGTTPKVLIHTGKFSAATQAGFAAAGWKLEAAAYPEK